MRLCIIQSTLPLYSISFFNRIRKLNPEIELVVLANLKSDDSLNQYHPEICEFSVQHLNSVSWGGVFIRPGILRALQKNNPDVIVFSGSPREWSQLIALCWWRLSGGRVISWGMFHRIGAPKVFTNIYFRLVGYLSQRCFTYTRTGAIMISHLGTPKNKIRVVGTAIDEQIPFKESSALSSEALQNFKTMYQIQGKKLILQVVRLNRSKRPELLIYALKKILTKRSDVMVALIGDGEMKSELELLAVKLGVASNILFLGAIYDEKLLCPWYLSAQVFVTPTFLGLSGHHAMSYGLPVVTDDSLDHQGSEFEILSEGLNGLTYREGDIDDLANTLLRVLDDSMLQNFMAINARKTIENVHNLNRKTQRFIREVKSLMAES
jgi:glycosyltransferase involved in cell wall biosynthesis